MAGVRVIEHAENPRELPGWDALAADRTFYASSGWLDFADSDRIARGHYLITRSANGSALTALSAHLSPHETNDAYIAGQVLPGADESAALVLGGRRGYLSTALGDTSELATMISAALEREPEAAGRWWWPYLPTEQARAVAEATGAAAVHLAGADCVLDVPAGGLEEYLDSLPARQRRTNVRREIRRYADGGLRTVRTTLAPHIELLGALSANVQRKYGHHHTPAQMAELLSRQAARLDHASVVFQCVAEDDPVPLGFCLAYRHGRELAVRLVGFDYERLRGADEYPNLVIHEAVRYCQEEGLSRLHLGMESYAAKCRRGALVRPLWALSSFTSAGRTDREDHAANLAAALPAREADAFLAEVRSGP